MKLTEKEIEQITEYLLEHANKRKAWLQKETRLKKIYEEIKKLEQERDELEGYYESFPLKNTVLGEIVNSIIEKGNK